MAAQRWFKVYTDILYDPKIASLSDSQFRTWIGLLALAISADDPGLIDLMPLEGTATTLHISVEELEAAVTRFVHLGLAEGADRGVRINRFARHRTVPSALPNRTRGRKAAQRARESGDVPSLKDRARAEHPASRKDTGPPPSPDAERLCHLLAESILANTGRRPNITATWLMEADRVFRLDKRPIEEALDLMKWCQQDSFWQGNILSPTKFRKQYDALMLHARRKRTVLSDGQGDTAWNEVLFAARRHGSRQRPEEITWSSPVILDVVRQLGWRNICEANTNDKGLRLRFLKLYEGLGSK